MALTDTQYNTLITNLSTTLSCANNSAAVLVALEAKLAGNVLGANKATLTPKILVAMAAIRRRGVEDYDLETHAQNLVTLL